MATDLDNKPAEHEKAIQAAQEPVPTEDKVLEAGAAMSQDFTPVKQICAHLNAFHVYASSAADPTKPARCVEANHYCTHLSRDIRQCLIYDSPSTNARLIGIEYMITPSLYKTLPAEERKLWHSHVFEVKSGMLVMPLPKTMPVPTAAWEVAETKEMEEVIGLYGKTYHLWQVDRGDVVPMGAPELMISFTGETQLEKGLAGLLNDRDQRFGTDSKAKKEKRKGIPDPQIHSDADDAWKMGNDAVEGATNS